MPAEPSSDSTPISRKDKPMTVRLSLFEDQVSGTTLEWSAAPRAIFVRSGRFTVHASEGAQELTATDCALFTSAVRIEGEGELWTFELAATPVTAMDAVSQARCVLAHEIELDATQPLVLRADRVEFGPGMETPRHGHKASGIRRLYQGRLVAEIGPELRRIDTGDAWFETGHDPVIGRNIAPASAFVRALVLPLDLLGQPTFIAWDAVEAAKPRGTRRTEYFDTVVRLET
jgi:quercetin dioxygenase-like cupin family protein